MRFYRKAIVATLLVEILARKLETIGEVSKDRQADYDKFMKMLGRLTVRSCRTIFSGN